MDRQRRFWNTELSFGEQRILREFVDNGSVNYEDYVARIKAFENALFRYTSSVTQLYHTDRAYGVAVAAYDDAKREYEEHPSDDTRDRFLVADDVLVKTAAKKDHFSGLVRESRYEMDTIVGARNPFRVPFHGQPQPGFYTSGGHLLFVFDIGVDRYETFDTRTMSKRQPAKAYLQQVLQIHDRVLLPPSRVIITEERRITDVKRVHLPAEVPRVMFTFREMFEVMDVGKMRDLFPEDVKLMACYDWAEALDAGTRAQYHNVGNEYLWAQHFNQIWIRQPGRRDAAYDRHPPPERAALRFTTLEKMK